jgi:hypothetical protein
MNIQNINSTHDLTCSQKQDLAGKYIDSQSVSLQNEIVEYIINKSREDIDAPFGDGDITNNTPTGQIEINGEWLTLDEDERDEKLELYEYLTQKAQTLLDHINSLEPDFDDGEREGNEAIYSDWQEMQEKIEANYYRLDSILDDLNGMDFEDYPEIFQWFLVSDNLAYHLEKRGECMLDNQFWGRTCCGQSIILDNVIQSIAFEVLAERVV